MSNRTKEQKKRAKNRRLYGAQYNSKTGAAPEISSPPMVEKPIYSQAGHSLKPKTEFFRYDSSLIYQDLVKTIVIFCLVVGILLIAASYLPK